MPSRSPSGSFAVIRKLIADGQLRAVKISTRVVRIRRTDLDDLLRPVSDAFRFPRE